MTSSARPELNANFIGRENLALVTTRQTREPFGALVVDRICGQHKIVATYDGSSVFPVYLYPSGAKAHLFDDSPTDAPNGRRPNLVPEFIADLTKRLGMHFVEDGKGDLTETFGPEDVFAYMYAVFHSPAYRLRYTEFLKSDFPRLPLTSDTVLFRALCALGDELVELHLMERIGAAPPGFPEAGSNTVDAVRYTEPTADTRGRVWINKTQYFEGVPPEVYEFQVGGYQVAQKWLKDRKGRMLTYDDLLHYERVCAALADTGRLMEAIDGVIGNNGGFPLA